MPTEQAAAGYRLPKPVEISVILTNLRSRQQFRDVLLVEIEADAAVLDLPRSSCAQGEEVTLDIRTQGLAPEVALQIRAKVTMQSFENNRAERGNSTLSFQNHDTAAWERLRSVFRARQELVVRTFVVMKA